MEKRKYNRRDDDKKGPAGDKRGGRSKQANHYTKDQSVSKPTRNVRSERPLRSSDGDARRDSGDRRSSSDRPTRNYSNDRPTGRPVGRPKSNDRNDRSRDERPYRSRDDQSDRRSDGDRRKSSDRPTRNYSNDRNQGRPSSGRPASGRGFNDRDDRNKDERPTRFNRDERPARRDDRPVRRDDDRRSSSDRASRFNKEERPIRRRDDDRNGPSDRPKRSSSNDRGTDRPFKRETERPSFDDRDKRSAPRRDDSRNDSERAPRRSREENIPLPGNNPDNRNKRYNAERTERRNTEDKPASKRPFKKEDDRKVERRPRTSSSDSDRRAPRKSEGEFEKPMRRKKNDDHEAINEPANIVRKNEPSEEIRLNRYISNSGVCSRRKADELISNGEVSVNGEVIRELGYKVTYADKIKYQGKLLKPGKLVYVLLNKPKDYITTMDDPLERRTVLDLTKSATDERIYPVGRLDRNTTGLLLMTNDGDLADRLAHPRNQVEKLYEVELDKSLSSADFEKIKNGVELEDGHAKVDEIASIDGKSKKFVGIRIHIGRNRIVRRIFESLGYEVVKLDRVIYAGLTKKDLPRGRCRHLTKEEIIYLKHLNKY